MKSYVLRVVPLIALALLSGVHSVFAYKELTDWVNSAKDIIGMKLADAQASEQVGKNQGLSNAFLAIGAAWALAAWWRRGPSAGRAPATFFASWALVAGVFGWYTFDKLGFLIKQALPGAIALIAAWLPVSRPSLQDGAHGLERL
jgi:uncharacterized membrane protein